MSSSSWPLSASNTASGQGRSAWHPVPADRRQLRVRQSTTTRMQPDGCQFRRRSRRWTVPVENGFFRTRRAHAGRSLRRHSAPVQQQLQALGPCRGIEVVPAVACSRAAYRVCFRACGSKSSLMTGLSDIARINTSRSWSSMTFFDGHQFQEALWGYLARRVTGSRLPRPACRCARPVARSTNRDGADIAATMHIPAATASPCSQLP